MMFSIIDRKDGLTPEVYEPRLTGRFALPDKIIISIFIVCNCFVGKLTAKSFKSIRSPRESFRIASNGVFWFGLFREHPQSRVLIKMR